jgi:two-component system, NarL family, nitrate/nitrite response regulator NarL
MDGRGRHARHFTRDAATEIPAHAARLRRPASFETTLGNNWTVVQMRYKFVIILGWCVMGCVSVIIADRYPVFLCGLISVLREQDDFDIVASCCNGTECIQAIRKLSPRIALLDISMPGLSGLEILATAASEGLCTRVLLLTASMEAHELATAAARGAYGVVPKDASPETLIGCLRRVAVGRRTLPFVSSGEELRQVQGRGARNGDTQDMLSMLTERERQIMQLVSEGLSNKEIGHWLDISDGTIKVHLHNIYQKLSINNRTTLAALAMCRQTESAWLIRSH